MRLDHVVLWTKDPAVAMDFYTRVVGLEPVRFDEFRTGEAPFPSVRVSADSILDLSPEDNGGIQHRVNHVCLAMTKAEYDALDQRLRAEGIDTSDRLAPTFGARGWGPEGMYFPDPDGNVIEARYYDD
ncbi:dioxygenase [Mycobacterium sp. ENV421]|uniref:VOC family protein n=1 Tax=Mycobacterium sp. ENV421 TaxID=1213407 RepID=UPI000C9B692B|nr:VOC family protein [Mycobacterium sp. ENV421]PND59381.1 dioxygenase [Mycobacterium sp. ENV421]